MCLSRLSFGLPRKMPWLVAPALVLFFMAAPTAVFAQSDSITPVEEFSQQLDQLKQTFTELGKKIDDSARSMDGLTDIAQARKEMEELRTAVSTLLGSVADNGELANIGVKALDRAREKLRAFDGDMRFKPEERQFLIEQWRKLKEETERATEELGRVRKEFAGLLQTLQTHEDFIDELVQIRQAQRAIDVIRQLTKDLRGASDQLKKLIGAIKPPGV
jgi:DNA repair exonuclease SbcCD ATPase subunit